MKIEDIHAFTSFVKFQSTRLAAQQLGISQPAVTRRIQNLEQVCAVQLFDRQSRPLKLTQMGRDIYAQCCVIEQEMQQLQKMIRLQHQNASKLHLGIPNSFSEIGLINILNQLKRDYPQIELELTAGWGSELLLKLQQGQLDAIISSVPDLKALPQPFPVQMMGSLSVRPIISKALHRAGVSSLDDLQQLGWILNTAGCGFRHALTEKLKQKQLKLNIEVAGSKLQLELISQGMGAGFAPIEIIQGYADFSQLAILNLPALNLDLVVVYVQHPTLSPVQQAAGEVVVQLFKAQLNLA